MLKPNFFFLFTLLVAYVAIAIRVDPYTTDLQINLNDILRDGRKTEYIVYTSVVEYDQVTTDFKDEELAGLCKQAWDEMKSLHAAWGNACTGRKKDFVTNNQPGMMSAIAVGNQIYFASSMKKNTPNIFLSNPDGALTQDMIRCWAAWWPDTSVPANTNDLHRNHGNCGEINAAAMFLKLNGKKIQASGTKAKIVAFGTTSETVQKPCGSQKDWDNGQFGCIDWAEYSNIDWVKRGTVPSQVNTIPKGHQAVSLNDVWTIRDVADIDAVKAQ